MRTGRSHQASFYVTTVFIMLLLCSCSQPSKKPAAPVTEEKTDTTYSLRDSLRLKKPTLHWEQMMSEGSEFYTTENIAASDRLLDQYLADLSSATDTSAAWKAVEEVVTAFNQLNKKTGFIETAEREELAAYILLAANAYGLNYRTDITEKWRREW